MWFATKAYQALGELNTGSDRTIAIVGSAIVDSYLTDVLNEQLGDETSHSKKVREKMLGPDRPLGAFASKIRLAYLMGLLSPTAYDDLDHLRWIRNKFAHYTEHGSFSTEEIKARCAKFKLVDSRVHEIEMQSPGPNTQMGGLFVSGGTIELSVQNHKEKLSNPRERYALTASLAAAAFEYFSRATGAQKPIF